MNYYNIRHWKKLDEIYVQVEDIVPPYDVNSEKSIYHINYKKKIDFNILLPTLKLYKETRWTDHINTGIFSSAAVIIASTRLFEIIKSESATNYQDFIINIEKDGEFKEYHVIYFYDMNENLVDYDKSDFFISNSLGNNDSHKKIIKFKNQDELIETADKIRHDPGSPKINYHKFNLNENINYDLFRLPSPMSIIVGSETFKNEVQLNNITGIEFVPIEEIETNPKFLKGYYFV